MTLIIAHSASRTELLHPEHFTIFHSNFPGFGFELYYEICGVHHQGYVEWLEGLKKIASSATARKYDCKRNVSRM